ncbi:MAG: MFS transporter [Gammaproteobacteria bacterium]
MADTRQRRGALVAVMLTALLTPLLLTPVNVAIPEIARAFDAGAVQVSWVATSYLLACAVFLLPFGRLADMIGRKRVFSWGAIVVAIASIGAAAAPNLPVLIVLRILQGLGASMLFATNVAILASVYPAERRGAAIGLTASVVYFSLTIGPMLGGWVVGHLGWRWVLVFHLPLALISIAITATLLRTEWIGPPGQKFDVPGALLFAAAIGAGVYGASVLPVAAGYALVGVSALGFVAFFAFERTRAQPLFDVRLLLGNAVFSMSCLAALAMYCATWGISFVMSLYLQHLKGMSPQQAGFVLMAQPIVQALLSPFAGRLADTVEPRIIASAGTAASFAGLLMLAALHAETSLQAIVGALALVGLGFAMFSAPNMNAIMGAVDPRHLGTAAGTVSVVRVLGQMGSMTVVTVAFALTMGRAPIDAAHFDALERAIGASFHVAAATCAAAFLFSLVRGRVKPRAT